MTLPLQTRCRHSSVPCAGISARPRARAPTCGTLVSAAGLAQLVEQLSCKQQVIGSSPIAGSTESLTAAPQSHPAVTRRGEVPRPR